MPLLPTFLCSRLNRRRKTLSLSTCNQPITHSYPASQLKRTTNSSPSSRLQCSSRLSRTGLRSTHGVHGSGNLRSATASPLCKLVASRSALRPRSSHLHQRLDHVSQRSPCPRPILALLVSRSPNGHLKHKFSTHSTSISAASRLSLRDLQRRAMTSSTARFLITPHLLRRLLVTRRS